MSAQQDLSIRAADDRDFPAMLAIINVAAQAYRGVIPEDCWQEPYMSAEALRAEIAAGVVFSLAEAGGVAVGLMGIQRVSNTRLIRHAYVRPDAQGRGVGGRLLRSLVGDSQRPVLIGTWAAATWAIGFYERHGFERVPGSVKDAMLNSYWTITPRQVETSIVLSRPALIAQDARDLIARARD
jgi:N-acetylglutamate synthase-like GNAT family acetyltransferase